MIPEDYTKFEKAKKRVAALKSFYNHILIFVLVNTIVFVSWFFWLPNTGIFEANDPEFLRWARWNLVTFPLGWGIALTIHGLSAYGKLDFFKNWEKRKIEEILENEEQNIL